MPKLFFLTFRPGAPDEALCALLPADVLRRCARIRRPEQAKAAAMGHLLARCALSLSSGRAPGEIAVARLPSGKPYSPGLHLEWSLSHTAGAAAVCVDAAPVGVDVERAGPVRPRVLERALSAREREYVLSAPEGQDVRFFEVWTRKEAVVKRDGRGLSKDINKVDAFSDACGALTTFRFGDFIVSACAEEPLTEQNIVRIDEDTLLSFFQNR